MKLFLPIALGVVCIALVVTLVKTTKDDNARHDEDVSTITSYSNRLDTAQADLVARGQSLMTLSNSLDECRSASLTLSNRLADAQSTVVQQSGQITNLNQQIAKVTAEKLALDQQRLNLTDQAAGLSNKLAQTEATLTQANHDYAALEYRLRRDIAERLLVERKFNNPAALQAQTQFLKTNPAVMVSEDRILAGLDIVVKSNGTYYVIAPN
jgi:chromosome segregation ATPase